MYWIMYFSSLRKMFFFPLKMPLQHQYKYWGEVNLVGSYQQHLSWIQPRLHISIPYFMQSNLMGGKQRGAEGGWRKENFYDQVSLSSPQCECWSLTADTNMLVVSCQVGSKAHYLPEKQDSLLFVQISGSFQNRGDLSGIVAPRLSFG